MFCFCFIFNHDYVTVLFVVILGQCYICGDEEILHLHRLTYEIDQDGNAACDNHVSTDPLTEESVFYRK